MCTQVYFQHEGKVIDGVGELADMLGGFDRIRERPLEADEVAEPLDPVSDRESCLCPVDVRASMAESDWHLLEWEDGFDFTAVKSSRAIERDARVRDEARYEAAMVEMRGAPCPTPPSPSYPTPSPATPSSCPTPNS